MIHYAAMRHNGCNWAWMAGPVGCAGAGLPVGLPAVPIQNASAGRVEKVRSMLFTVKQQQKIPTYSPFVIRIREWLLFFEIVLGGLMGIWLFSGGEGAGDGAYNLLFTLRSVFSVGAIGLALFLRGGLPQNHRMAAVFAYVAYVMASTVWSVDPAFTARAAADLGLFVLAVALLCNRLPARRIINVFLNILGWC
jgi:hypothetical protein